MWQRFESGIQKGPGKFRNGWKSSRYSDMLINSGTKYEEVSKLVMKAV